MDGLPVQGFQSVVEPRPPTGPGRLGLTLAVMFAALAGGVTLDVKTADAQAGGAIGILVAVVAAWTLAPRLTAGVVGVGVALRVAVIAEGRVDVPTGLIQLVVAVLVAFAVARAADAVVARRRQTEATLAAAMARERAVIREGRRRVHELSLLEEAAATLAQPGGAAQIHDQIVRLAALILSPPGTTAFRSALHLRDGGSLRTVAQFNPAPSPAGERPMPLDEHPMLAVVVRDGRSVAGRLEDMPQTEGSRARVRQLGVTWVALVPVSVDGAVVGVLSVTTADEHPFTEPEIRRLEAVGNLGGLALANLERMETLETMAGQARALERSKSHFLNLASHEMRGPLAVVSGYLEMIADGDLGVVDDRIRDRILPLVRSKVGELTDIVERMLTTARLEEDTTDLVTGDVDVSAAVEELVGPGGALVEEGFERLELRLPETRPVARADRASVATIVSNLVDNACKFSPPGSPVVVTVVDAGADVLVSVTDRGPGIQPHHVDRLFTRFGRIITRENSHVRGTGLGLWLCRELARRQGGDVTFETQPGRGSTFTLRLPRSTRDLELEGRRDNAVVAAKATM